MRDHYRNSSTLVNRRPFAWRREEDGSLTIRAAADGPVRTTFSPEQYDAVLDLIASSPDGIRLGARADGRVPVGSLGYLMSRFGVSRPHASWVAAIAVEEGFAVPDYRGPGGGGLWLMTSPEGHDRAVGRTMPVDDDWERIDEVARGLRPDNLRAAREWRALAERLERIDPVDGAGWEFALADIEGDTTTEVLDGILAWEREMNDARYLYRFRVADAVSASLCRDALATAKCRNVGGRRFSRLNEAPESSACLYIGSSRALASRVRQHLGLAHRGTYALQIRHWRPETPLDGVLHLDASRYAPGTDDDVLQALEDSLWPAERPHFGRLGAR